MTLHFRDGRETTLLRYRNRVEITVRMCTQKLYVVCRVRKYAKIVQMTPLRLQSDPGGGALRYFLGGFVPPGTPNWHPVLGKISPKIDTPL